MLVRRVAALRVTVTTSSPLVERLPASLASHGSPEKMRQKGYGLNDPVEHHQEHYRHDPHEKSTESHFEELEYKGTDSPDNHQRKNDLIHGC